MFRGSFVMRNETSWFILPEAHSPWLATLIAVDELQEACNNDITWSGLFWWGAYPLKFALIAVGVAI